MARSRDFMDGVLAGIRGDQGSPGISPQLQAAAQQVRAQVTPEQKQQAYDHLTRERSGGGSGTGVIDPKDIMQGQTAVGRGMNAQQLVQSGNTPGGSIRRDQHVNRSDLDPQITDTQYGGLNSTGRPSSRQFDLTGIGQHQLANGAGAVPDMSASAPGPLWNPAGERYTGFTAGQALDVSRLPQHILGDESLNAGITAYNTAIAIPPEQRTEQHTIAIRNFESFTGPEINRRVENANALAPDEEWDALTGNENPFLQGMETVLDAGLRATERMTAGATLAESFGGDAPWYLKPIALLGDKGTALLEDPVNTIAPPVIEIAKVFAGKEADAGLNVVQALFQNKTSGLKEWIEANPEQALSAENSDQLWDSYVADKSWWEKSVLAVAMDPLTYVPLIGALGQSLGPGSRAGRTLTRTGSILDAPDNFAVSLVTTPGRVADDLVGQILQKSVRGLYYEGGRGPVQELATRIGDNVIDPIRQGIRQGRDLRSINPETGKPDPSPVPRDLPSSIARGEEMGDMEFGRVADLFRRVSAKLLAPDRKQAVDALIRRIETAQDQKGAADAEASVLAGEGRVRGDPGFARRPRVERDPEDGEDPNISGNDPLPNDPRDPGLPPDDTGAPEFDDPYEDVGGSRTRSPETGRTSGVSGVDVEATSVPGIRDRIAARRAGERTTGAPEPGRAPDPTPEEDARATQIAARIEAASSPEEIEEVITQAVNEPWPDEAYPEPEDYSNPDVPQVFRVNRSPQPEPDTTPVLGDEVDLEGVDDDPVVLQRDRYLQQEGLEVRETRAGNRAVYRDGKKINRKAIKSDEDLDSFLTKRDPEYGIQQQLDPSPPSHTNIESANEGPGPEIEESPSPVVANDSQLESPALEEPAPVRESPVQVTYTKRKVYDDQEIEDWNNRKRTSYKEKSQPGSKKRRDEDVVAQNMLVDFDDGVNRDSWYDEERRARWEQEADDEAPDTDIEETSYALTPGDPITVRGEEVRPNVLNITETLKPGQPPQAIRRKGNSLAQKQAHTIWDELRNIQAEIVDRIRTDLRNSNGDIGALDFYVTTNKRVKSVRAKAHKAFDDPDLGVETDFDERKWVAKNLSEEDEKLYWRGRNYLRYYKEHALKNQNKSQAMGRVFDQVGIQKTLNGIEGDVTREDIGQYRDELMAKLEAMRQHHTQLLGNRKHLARRMFPKMQDLQKKISFLDDWLIKDYPVGDTPDDSLESLLNFQEALMAERDELWDSFNLWEAAATEDPLLREYLERGGHPETKLVTNVGAFKAEARTNYPLAPGVPERKRLDRALEPGDRFFRGLDADGNADPESSTPGVFGEGTFNLNAMYGYIWGATVKSPRELDAPEIELLQHIDADTVGGRFADNPTGFLPEHALPDPVTEDLREQRIRSIMEVFNPDNPNAYSSEMRHEKFMGAVRRILSTKGETGSDTAFMHTRLREAMKPYLANPDKTLDITRNNDLFELMAYDAVKTIQSGKKTGGEILGRAYGGNSVTTRKSLLPSDRERGQSRADGSLFRTSSADGDVVGAPGTGKVNTSGGTDDESGWYDAPDLRDEDIPDYAPNQTDPDKPFEIVDHLEDFQNVMEATAEESRITDMLDDFLGQIDESLREMPVKPRGRTFSVKTQPGDRPGSSRTMGKLVNTMIFDQSVGFVPPHVSAMMTARKQRLDILEEAERVRRARVVNYDRLKADLAGVTMPKKRNYTTMISDEARDLLGREFLYHKTFKGRTYFEAYRDIEIWLDRDLKEIADIRNKTSLTEADTARLTELEKKYDGYGEIGLKDPATGKWEAGLEKHPTYVRDQFRRAMYMEYMGKSWLSKRTGISRLGWEYSKFISRWGRAKLLNPVSAPAFIIQNHLGNGMALLSQNEFAAMFRWANPRDTFRHIRQQGKGHDAIRGTWVDGVIQQSGYGDINPSVEMTNVRSTFDTRTVSNEDLLDPFDPDYTPPSRVRRISGKLGSNRVTKKASRYAGKPLDIAGDIASGMEAHARSSVWGVHFLKGQIDRRPMLQEWIHTNAVHNRHMPWSVEDVDMALDTMGTGVFSPNRARDTFYRLARARGVPERKAAGMADQIGRRWANLQKDADDYATRKMNDVLFSYEYTYLDAQVRKFVPFHYWATRAIPLYARSLTKNPAVVASYMRATEGLEKIGEEEGWPDYIQGMVGMLNSPWGMTVMFSPVSVFGMISLMQAGAREHGDDDTMLAGVLNKVQEYTGLSIYPWIGNPMNMVGALGSTSKFIDPLGFTKERRIIGSGIQWAASQGWLGEESQRLLGRPFQERLEEAREFVTNHMPFVDTIEAGDSVSMAEMDLQSIMENNVRERDGLGPDDPFSQQQIEEISISMEDPTSAAYQDALSDYASGNLVAAAGSIVYPSGMYAQPTGDNARDRDEADAWDSPTPQGVPNRNSDPYADNRITAEEQQWMNVWMQQTGKAYEPGMLEDYRDRIKTDRTMATSTPEHAVLNTQQSVYYELGTDQEKQIAKTYETIRRGSVPYRLVIDGQRYSSDDIAAMSPDGRKELASRWLKQDDARQAAYDSYQEKRDAFKTQHPQYAEYLEWQNSVRDYPSLSRYRRDLALENPNAAQYFQDRKETIIAENPEYTASQVQTALDNEVIGLDTFEAIQGIQRSRFDSKPLPTSGGPGMPSDPAREASGNDGGDGSSGSPGNQMGFGDWEPETVEDVNAALADHQQWLDDINAYASEAYGMPVDLQAFPPGPIRDSMIMQIPQDAVPEPDNANLAEQYMEWAVEQQSYGRPSDVASFIAEKDRKREERRRRKSGRIE